MYNVQCVGVRKNNAATVVVPARALCEGDSRIMGCSNTTERDETWYLERVDELAPEILPRDLIDVVEWLHDILRAGEGGKAKSNGSARGVLRYQNILQNTKSATP